MALSSKLYARLPVWAQHAAVTTYGLYWYWVRFGPGFRQSVADYEARDRWTAEQWRDWQADRVRWLLDVAVAHVPYYRETWGAGERAAARAGNLQDLPLLEKAPIRADPMRFVRDDLTGRRMIYHTSGSTGTPIAAVYTLREMRETLAVREVRSCRWAGVSFSMPRATFSGRMVEPDPLSTGPFYRFNAVEHQVYLSPFHLGPGTAAQYVGALRRHGVRWMTGYAVSYYLLARHILEQGIEVPPLDAVITTSEKVTPRMREVMERAFGCRVYEEYSTVENAVFASECEAGHLHVSPDVGVVEILRPDGSPCDPGEPGEVVVTCLMRPSQPFVRYRLGDVAAWGGEPCPCGRGMPVLKEIVGRIEDVVVGPDGREMVRFHGIFVDQPNVREGQIIQERRDAIRARVAVTPEFGPADEADIIHRIQQRLGPTVQVTVEKVDQIPRTRAGKFPAVVSLIGKTADVAS